MSDRAQVILVVTGLGAPSLETVMPGFAVQKVMPSVLQDQPATMSQSIPSLVAHPVESLPLNLAHTASNDLDLPAFLRRRARLPN